MAKLKGIPVGNGSVAAFIRKHGPPTHSKPQGPDQTVLYYPDLSADAEDDAPEFENYAGKRTPAGKTRIIQGHRSGSRVTFEERGTGPRAPLMNANSQNVNELAKSADIDSDADLEADHEAKLSDKVKDSIIDSDAETADVEVETEELADIEEVADKVDAPVTETESGQVVAEEPLDDLTVRQLEARARELDIEGRSGMNKEELIAAISEHESKE
jgi:hypothetical protein